MKWEEVLQTLSSSRILASSQLQKERFADSLFWGKKQTNILGAPSMQTVKSNVLHAAETNHQSTNVWAPLPLLSLQLSVSWTRIKRSASSFHYRLSSRVPHANHRTGSRQWFVDMSAMCLCRLNQGQAANLSNSHSGRKKKKHSVCNMGKNPAKTITLYCHYCVCRADMSLINAKVR